MKVYFVGSESIVQQVDYTGHSVGSRIIFNKFGQCEDVPDEEAKAWMPTTALLTQEEWDSCGFTPEELNEKTGYPTPGRQKTAPQDFQVKLKKAHALYSEKWQILRGYKKDPNAPSVPAEPPKTIQTKTDTNLAPPAIPVVAPIPDAPIKSDSPKPEPKPEPVKAA